jgi:hypothetical protein
MTTSRASGGGGGGGGVTASAADEDDEMLDYDGDSVVDLLNGDDDALEFPAQLLQSTDSNNNESTQSQTSNDDRPPESADATSLTVPRQEPFVHPGGLRLFLVCSAHSRLFERSTQTHSIATWCGKACTIVQSLQRQRSCQSSSSIPLWPRLEPEHRANPPR